MPRHSDTKDGRRGAEREDEPPGLDDVGAIVSGAIDDRVQHVQLDAEFAVPERFRSTYPIMEGDEVVARWSVTVQVGSDGEPRLEEFVLHFHEPRDLAGLNRPDLAALVRYALTDQAIRFAQIELAAERGGAIILPKAQTAAMRRRAERITRPRRGERATDEFLGRVVKWYGDGGVERIRHETGRSERTARRWLSLAKERGLR
jgi:hypothetical protein